VQTTLSWMGSLDGRQSLSRLSIPGTHNSGALYEPVYGTSKCQDLTISDQLAIGVRYLDIRCRHVDNAFAIYHGPISQHLTFAAVVTACIDFLADNPTECVVMSVNEESIPSRNTRTFEQTFAAYVAEHPQRWELSTTIPTLDVARGKIVLLRRFPADSYMKGIEASWWPINTTFTIAGPANLKVQDQYIVPDNFAKLGAIRSLYDEARSANDEILYLNYTSGYRRGLLGFPDIRVVSDFINPAVSQYFNVSSRGRFGITVTDFVDKATCALIIATNDAGV
jgi:1-phosphatidylinositol phosphodiesterase